MFDIGKLKQPEVQNKFKIELMNRFRVLDNFHDSEIDTMESIEREWNDIKTIYRHL